MLANYAIALGESAIILGVFLISWKLRKSVKLKLLILCNSGSLALLGSSSIYQISLTLRPTWGKCAGITCGFFSLLSGCLLIRYSLRVSEWARRTIRQATYDQLTGALSRHKGHELLSQSTTTDGLLLIDIDHFKQFNAAHGHSTGDAVLQIVCDRIAQTLRGRKGPNSVDRQPDAPIRWGGDEILVVISDCDWNQTLAIAQRIIENIQLPARLHNGLTLHITVSIGATVSKPTDTVERKLERVDRAVFKAKDTGRNKVCGEWPSV